MFIRARTGSLREQKAALQLIACIRSWRFIAAVPQAMAT